MLGPKLLAAFLCLILAPVSVASDIAFTTAFVALMAAWLITYFITSVSTICWLCVVSFNNTSLHIILVFYFQHHEILCALCEDNT